MGNDFNRELCNERHKDIKGRLDRAEDRIDSLEKCTIKLTQMVDKYDSRLDSQEKRITKIERKPLKVIEAVIGYAVSALFGALAAILVGWFA